jgi:hypothetical protein
MTNQYFLARLAGHDPNLRAADADRERVAERLRTSHAEGRLDTTELQQRIERCYDAKTMGELSELVRDLPHPDDVERRPLAWAAARRMRLAPLAALLLALILVSSLAGHHHGGSWLWVPVVFLVWRMSWWRRRRWYAGARRAPGDWV